jgi:penicillin amidase
VPLDGSDPANRWQGLVPPAQMPQRTNPPTGFLAAANARVNAPGDGPLVSADNAAPYRIARIRTFLGENGRLSVQDMQDLQMDWMDGQARMLLPTLLEALDPAALSTRAAPLTALMQAWGEKPLANRDSAPALIFQHWYLDIARHVFAERTAELYPRLLQRSYLLNHALDHLILHDADSAWWRGERGAVISAALNDSANRLADLLGDDPGSWRLDAQLHVALQHELGRAEPLLAPLFDRADEPWGGSVSTVGRARYDYTDPLRVNSGATVRVVAEMSAQPRVAAVIPGGQSGHPLSAHYADQYAGWLQGQLLPIAPRPDGLPQDSLVLTPEN